MKFHVLRVSLISLALAVAGFLAIGGASWFGATQALAASRAHTAEFKFFYASLKPHGRWVRHSRYDWIWKPRVAPGWRPYTVGRWRHTKRYGWVWQSAEGFGTITFHYGWWGRDVAGDWFWVPGYVWSPAWVVWKPGKTHVGWAPLPPEYVWGKRIDVALSVSWSVRFDPPPTYWAFVETRYIAAPSITQVVVAPRQNITYVNNSTTINNTAIINQTIVNRGLDVAELERQHNVKIETAEVVASKSASSVPEGTSASESAVSIVQPFGDKVDAEDVVTSTETADIIPAAERDAAPMVEEDAQAAAPSQPEPQPSDGPEQAVTKPDMTAPETPKAETTAVEPDPGKPEAAASSDGTESSPFETSAEVGSESAETNPADTPTATEETPSEPMEETAGAAAPPEPEQTEPEAETPPAVESAGEPAAPETPPEPPAE